jgi:hypothetical protein
MLLTGPPIRERLAPSERLERLAQAGIERVLSRVLDTDVTVGGVTLDSAAHVLRVHDVQIANPKGFGEGEAISVEAIRVEADPRSLFSPEPEVRLIGVSGATINADTKLPGGSNLKRLMDNAKEARVARFRAGERSKKKWRIEKGVLESWSVNFRSGFPGSTPRRAVLDKIEMDFLGSDGRGMTADQVLTRLFARLVQELGLVHDSVPESLPEMLFETLDKAA